MALLPEKRLGWIQERLSLTHREVGRCLGDSCVPLGMRTDRELLRRSRLQIRFGWMGAVLGFGYTVFYVAIGHWYGAEIIALCSLVFSLVPFLLKRTVNLHFTGQLYGLILLCCFTGLALVEGGVHGHALAWMAAVPMSLLLLLELRDALWWALLCLAVTTTFGIMELRGHEFPKTYDLKWETMVSFAGFGALLPVILLLGVVFERNRARAESELKETLRELSETNQVLRKVNEDKNEFLKIAAHDLKNPLAAINGSAELLMEEELPTLLEIQEAASTVLRQSHRMMGIISNLLDVQRIEEGSMLLNQERCALEQILESMVRTYARRAAQKSINIFLQREDNVPAVRADESAVEHILENLLSNAVKYSPHGTLVDCVISTDGDFVCVEVRDQGPGLSEEDQKNLFKKFSRLTPQPTGGESSNGLGLWIVRRMALAMGGDVLCHSELGAGSTFELRLPRWQNERSKAAAPAPADRPS